MPKYKVTPKGGKSVVYDAKSDWDAVKKFMTHSGKSGSTYRYDGHTGEIELSYPLAKKRFHRIAFVQKVTKKRKHISKKEFSKLKDYQLYNIRTAGRTTNGELTREESMNLNYVIDSKKKAKGIKQRR